MSRFRCVLFFEETFFTTRNSIPPHKLLRDLRALVAHETVRMESIAIRREHDTFATRNGLFTPHALLRRERGFGLRFRIQKAIRVSERGRRRRRRRRRFCSGRGRRICFLPTLLTTRNSLSPHKLSGHFRALVTHQTTRMECIPFGRHNCHFSNANLLLTPHTLIRFRNRFGFRFG